MEIYEDENITNLLNLFMIYYKRKNNMNDGTAMFDHINRNEIMIQTNQIIFRVFSPSHSAWDPKY